MSLETLLLEAYRVVETLAPIQNNQTQANVWAGHSRYRYDLSSSLGQVGECRRRGDPGAVVLADQHDVLDLAAAPVGDTTADRQNFGKCCSFSAVSAPIFASKKRFAAFLKIYQIIIFF